ncbi:MAG: TetR family transcriptional regulator [Methylophilaceae bacterium]|nr:MAG: TetR family transcriptional regulator [Methylophilaceae bacterium]
MPPKVKTEAERQQLRTLIIDAARELFIARGVESVTMREVGKRIGYSATSIYSHFADKEALLRAVCDTDFLTLASSLNGVMQIPDPLERMIAFGHSYAQFALSHPNHYRLMFMTPHEPCTPENSNVEQNNAEQDAYMQLKLVVTAVYEAGRFREDLTDIDLIVQTVWAGMHGACSLEITMSEDDWFEWSDISDRLNLMLDVLIRGLIRE